MRFVTFEKAGLAIPGVRLGSDVVELTGESSGAPVSLLELLRVGNTLEMARRCLERSRTAYRYPLAELKLLPPIPRPGKIVCVGLNYVDHRAEAGLQEPPKFPGMFHKVSTSIVGHGTPIRRPKVSEKLDFEGELAVVIGRTCHRVSSKTALEYVFGYTILNDGSVRDYQVDKALAAGKNFDASGSMGPAIVTVDELPNGAAGLGLKTRVNGTIMQDSNTRHMIFGVAEIIALTSDVHTLEPGDVISTGTCAGVGGARKPPIWLKAGDVLEIEIEGIGTLRNPIDDEE